MKYVLCWAKYSHRISPSLCPFAAASSTSITTERRVLLSRICFSLFFASPFLSSLSLSLCRETHFLRCLAKLSAMTMMYLHLRVNPTLASRDYRMNERRRGRTIRHNQSRCIDMIPHYVSPIIVDGRTIVVRPRRILLSSFRFRSRCERRIITYDVGAAVDNHDDKKNAAAPRAPR